MQRALIQYRNPKNYDLVMEALRSADRMDLVGFGKECLIRPKNDKNFKPYGAKKEAPKKEVPKKKKAIRNVHKKKAK